MFLGEAAMENAAALASLEVASDLKRRCGYPTDRPLVGDLRCSFKRATEEAADEKGNVTFVWTFACQPSAKNSLGVNGETAVVIPGRRVVYASRPLFPPRNVMNAACVALCMEVLPTKSLPFAKGIGGMTVVAMGSPKMLPKLPGVQLLDALPNLKGKKKQDGPRIRLTLAQVSVGTWVCHSGPRPTKRSKSLVYNCKDLFLATTDDEPIGESDSPPKTKRKTTTPTARKQVLKDDIRVTHALSECNAEGGFHQGLRDVYALAVVIAEIEKAKLKKNNLDVSAAVRAVECDPFRWQQRAERRRLVLLLKDASGEFHATCAFLGPLVKHCAAQTEPPKGQE